MKLHSEHQERSAGFSLVEVMVALAISGAILLLVFQGYSRSLSIPHRFNVRYFQTEFARSLLEEYAVRYPEMARTGIFHDQWVWEITEETVENTERVQFDSAIKLVKLTTRVSDVDQTNGTTQLSLVVVVGLSP